MKMKILDTFNKKIKELEYRKYIDEHRQNVHMAFTEMVMTPGLSWMNWDEEFCFKLGARVEAHDMSKYSAEEFDAYRAYYHPVDALEKQGAKGAFNEAWEHHWKTNRHHWQARVNDDDALTEERQLDCLENILDWMAMGYKFNDKAWEYYDKHKHEIVLPEKQIEFMERVLYSMRDNPWKDDGSRI